MSIELESAKLTPMMAQWTECKNEAKEALLFFRLGDFYEAFCEDAEIIAKELNLTLTERQGIPMCGVPWHSSEAYIERLVTKGYRVAIAEQMEDPKSVKGLVKRKVVRMLSPGTQVIGALSDEKAHNFFASITKHGEGASALYGLSLIDVTCAYFIAFECRDLRTLVNELCRYRPKELLLSKKVQAKEAELLCELKLNFSHRVQTEEDFRFEHSRCEGYLLRQFAVATLDGMGMKEKQAAITAAGALLAHVKERLLIPLDHIKTITPYESASHLLLDRATLANLEVISPLNEGKKEQTLFSIIDETKTAMGARKLAEWLKAPLIDVEAIKKRQDAVEELLAFSKASYTDACRFDDALKAIRDIARLIIRIQTGYAGPREYTALASSLEPLPLIKKTLSQPFFLCFELNKLLSEIQEHQEAYTLIKASLVANPPLRASDGDLFQAGLHPELDELRILRQNSQEWLTNYQTRLRQETNIKTLKVGFNKMFGYYIEVSRGQAEKMPDSFSRRQTLVNGERYITAELKEYEEKILTADEKIAKIESALFIQLQKAVATHCEAILKTAEAIGQVDVLRSFAKVAEKRGYVRPLVDNSKTLHIVEGRHPVIEVLASHKKFIPNDISLDGQEKTLMLITGPNMAGKSTYIRQVAALVILAQIGAFIPAKEAHIGVVDKLFSRIGASDDLARGQSTFMVEMAETANILHQATARSLVILDEIGRGTSTYDGISIAWAVAEYLLKNDAKRAKTLFATHYYELTELENSLPQAVNYTVAISEGQGEITFLHKIVKGKANRSYGVHVARLAGLPQEVVQRAKELLEELENNHGGRFGSTVHDKNSPVSIAKEEPKRSPPLPSMQPDLFLRLVVDQIKALDLNSATPLEAFTKIIEWKKMLL